MAKGTGDGRLPATPQAGQPPKLTEDPRYQATAVILLTLLMSVFKGKISEELTGPITTVLIVVIGLVLAPLYLLYGIMMAKLRQRYQEATQEALIQAAQSPEPVDTLTIPDPKTPDKVHIVKLKK